MQIQDIEVIFFVLSLVFLSNIKILLQITCSAKNHIKYYIFNHLKLFIFTKETNFRTTPDHSSYITIIAQYAEGNHYNAVNRELRFGNATCFYFQSDSSFATK